jgi:hypothetical protein
VLPAVLAQQAKRPPDYGSRASNDERGWLFENVRDPTMKSSCALSLPPRASWNQRRKAGSGPKRNAEI